MISMMKQYRGSAALCLLAMAFVVVLSVVGCVDEKSLIEPPKIYFASEGKYEMAANDTLILKPRVAYDNNSTYEWLVDGKKVSTDLRYKFIPDAMKDYDLTFSVDNEYGSDSYSLTVSVVKKIDFSKYDNYKLRKKTTLSMEADTMKELGGFLVDGLLFKSDILERDTNNVATYYNGFAACNKVNPSTVLTNTIIGCAYVSSTKENGYMSVCNDVGVPAVVMFDRPYTVKSMKMANDNLVFLISRYGLFTIDTVQVCDHVRENDYYRVRVQGLDQNGNANGSEFAYDLINCEFSDPSRYYRCSDWVEVKMNSLGAVYGLKMEVECNMENYPLRFCIDDLRLQD